jgi:hypothetical protein
MKKLYKLYKLKKLLLNPFLILLLKIYNTLLIKLMIFFINFEIFGNV